MSEFHTDSIESSTNIVVNQQINEKSSSFVNDCVRNTWNDTYMARKRVFSDGQCEIVICKEKFFIGSALIRKAALKIERAEQEANGEEVTPVNRAVNDEVAARRAKKNVRLCCKEIGADRMVTLTHRENVLDRDLALKHFDLFRRKLGKHQKFLYVAVIEPQERGSLHFHIAVRGRQNYHLLRAIWYSVCGLGQSGEQMGQVNVRDPHRFGFGKNGAHKLASYIAKYCGKSMDCRDLNQKRYFRSRGIVLPEVIAWRLASTDMLTAVQVAFAVAAEHGLEGVQTWCNNALGVVWLATAPHDGALIMDCPF